MLSVSKFYSVIRKSNTLSDVLEYFILKYIEVIFQDDSLILQAKEIWREVNWPIYNKPFN